MQAAIAADVNHQLHIDNKHKKTRGNTKLEAYRVLGSSLGFTHKLLKPGSTQVYPRSQIPSYKLHCCPYFIVTSSRHVVQGILCVIDGYAYLRYVRVSYLWYIYINGTFIYALIRSRTPSFTLIFPFNYAHDRSSLSNA